VTPRNSPVLPLTPRTGVVLLDCPGAVELSSPLSEKQVTELLGTSKTPVREAFAHLQSLGLIEVIPQKGGLVFRPKAEQVRDLCEVRLELESPPFQSGSGS
jgi:DNA-binding GntR family transcriptional regulator